MPWSQKIVPIYHVIDDAKSCGILSGQELTSVRVLLLLADKLKCTLASSLNEYPEFKKLSFDYHYYNTILEKLYQFKKQY